MMWRLDFCYIFQEESYIDYVCTIIYLVNYRLVNYQQDLCILLWYIQENSQIISTKIYSFDEVTYN
jgi:hypothetical protein